MNQEYHFQLVFLRLVLKRNVLSQSILRITLLQTSKELDPSSTAFQTQEINIRKNQKIIDLQSMKTFTFNASKASGENKFMIKYEIKGNSEERVRSIPVDTQKMISEFVKSKKSVFEQSYGGQNAEISYKFYIQSKEYDNEVFNLLVTPYNKEVSEQAGNENKRSNSISRGKRPPNLNISKRGVIASPPTNQNESSQINNQNIKNVLNNNKGSLLALSPVSDQPNKMPFLGLRNLQSHEQNSSVSGTHKKISSLPLSQIQKVNELMATHHRPHVQEHHHQFYLSYKLKIVIVMFIIGIAFLVIDTFSDRKSYNQPKKVEKHAKDPHEVKHENTHAKSHKKEKNKPSKTSQRPQKPKTKKGPVSKHSKPVKHQ